MASMVQMSGSILGKKAKRVPSSQTINSLQGRSGAIIEKATPDPTGDIPSEHSGAKLFRKGVLLFVLE